MAAKTSLPYALAAVIIVAVAVAAAAVAGILLPRQSRPPPAPAELGALGYSEQVFSEQLKQFMPDAEIFFTPASHVVSDRNGFLTVRLVAKVVGGPKYDLKMTLARAPYHVQDISDVHLVGP